MCAKKTKTKNNRCKKLSYTSSIEYEKGKTGCKKKKEMEKNVEKSNLQSFEWNQILERFLFNGMDFVVGQLPAISERKKKQMKK